MALKMSKVEISSFFTKWCDPLDLSKLKKLLDLAYIYPRGVRRGAALFFFWKSVFMEHPNMDAWTSTINLIKLIHFLSFNRSSLLDELLLYICKPLFQILGTYAVIVFSFHKITKAFPITLFTKYATSD